MAVPIVIGRSMRQQPPPTHTTGEMAEWSNAAVLKTVVPQGTGGSNPSFSAKETHNNCYGFFILKYFTKLLHFHPKILVYLDL